MTPLPIPARLPRLLARLIDGDLSADEAAELGMILSGNGPAQQYYFAYLDLHEELVERLSPPIDTAITEVLASPGGRAAISWKMLASSIVAVAVAFYGVFFLLSWDLLGDGSRNRTMLQAENEPPVQKSELAARLMFGDASVETDNRRLSPNESLVGKALRVSSGLAEFRFGDGVRVVVEGPAELEATSKKLAHLKYGRLLAEVPQDEIGFTVQTPTAKIVDLGTEFGVVAEPSGRTAVSVFKGEVDVESRGEAVLAPREGGADGVRHRLVAGQSTWIVRAGESVPTVDPFAKNDFRERLKQFADLRNAIENDANRFIAYQVPARTQPLMTPIGAFDGPVGMDFDVLKPIDVHRLGVFDAGEDGFHGDTRLYVHLWTRDNGGTPDDPTDDRPGLIRVTATFTQAIPGELVGASRFKSLPSPMRLEAGSYTLVAAGFNQHDRMANSRGKPVGSDLFPWTTNDGGGSLAFVGACRFLDGRAADEFPLPVDEGPANRYAAGTFEFSPVDSRR